MQLQHFNTSQTEWVIALFTRVFTDSEGEAEGLLLGQLVSDLIATTAPEDLIGCVAVDENKVLGTIFFSRFQLPTLMSAFLLSPVAIATEQQGQGLGQRLIQFGLAHLKEMGAEVAITYGDPNFYSKVGFHHISEAIIQAPVPLSHPEGWLAQSLTGRPIRHHIGATQCAKALQNPQYW